MYDLNELKAFAAVMESGNLSLTARKLGLAKATVSRRIRQLEDKVGQPLLRRQSNRLLPTEAGVLFEGYCQQILALADSGRQALEELREEVSGELTLHVHEAFARGWLATQVERFMASHPQVRVVLRTHVLKPQVTDEHILWLWLGEIEECGLRQETLGRLKRGVYAHPDYLARHGEPSHPRELPAHAWIDMLDGAGSGLQLTHPQQGSFSVDLPPSRMQVDQLVLHADAIVRGLGVGILPHWTVALRERGHPGSLVPCLQPWEAAPQTVTLLYPHGHLPRRARGLIDYLRQAVPADWLE